MSATPPSQAAPAAPAPRASAAGVRRRSKAPTPRGLRLLWALCFAGAVFNLLMGVCGGLMRIGTLPPHLAAPNAWHGALMVGGVFGTLISLERAVAVRRRWGVVAPLAAAAGGLALLAGQVMAAWALWMAAAAVLLALYALTLRVRWTLHGGVEAAGALAWGIGTAAAALGAPSAASLIGWCAFLLLTIVGERRELSQFVRLRAASRWAFNLSAAAVMAAVALAWVAPHAAVQLWWAACCALALWLLACDFAPRQWRAPQWRGHAAQALSVGYAWLLVAGLLGLTGALPDAGVQSLDGTALHALLLGFVFAMVFGHAPIMLPALAGITPGYVPWARAAVWLLAASLLLRIGATHAGWPMGRALAGAGHAAALALFAAAMLTGIARRAQRGV